MHRKKLIAPIVIAVILALWLLSWGLTCLLIPDIPFIIKLIGLLFSLGLLGVVVFVLIERINEIRKGEEDDLSNY